MPTYEEMLGYVRVAVPATSANLGPGFDSMGIALDLWNEFLVALRGDGGPTTVEVHGEGERDLPRDETHLMLATMFDELKAHGAPRPAGITLVCNNEVPSSSGLGSSSSAVVGGLLAAACLRLSHEKGHRVRPHEIDLHAVLSRAVEVEGHGDNVCPAIHGGLQVVYTHHEQYRNRAIPIPPTRVVVCVPDYAYPTSQARAALPKSISHADAVFNIGHSMLVAEALRSQDDVLLSDALRDALHEQYRLPDIPGAVAAKRAATQSGAIAACLSGAGPGLLAFARRGHDDIGEAMVDAFQEAGLSARYWVLAATVGGARMQVG